MNRKPRKPVKPDVTVTQFRVSGDSVSAVEREIAVLQDDGESDESIVVGVLLAAIGHAAKTECFSPKELGRAFQAALYYHLTMDNDE